MSATEEPPMDEAEQFREEIRKFHESVLKNRDELKKRRGRPPTRVRTSIDPEELDDDISPPSEDEVDPEDKDRVEEVDPPSDMDQWETMSATTSLTGVDWSYVTTTGTASTPITPETEYTTESSLSHYVSSETDPNEKSDDPDATTESVSSPSSEPSEESEDPEPDPNDQIFPDFPIDPKNPKWVPFAKGAWPPQWGPQNDSKDKVASKLTSQEQTSKERSVGDYKISDLFIGRTPFFATALMNKTFAEYPM